MNDTIGIREPIPNPTDRAVLELVRQAYTGCPIASYMRLLEAAAIAGQFINLSHDKMTNDFGKVNCAVEIAILTNPQIFKGHAND